MAGFTQARQQAILDGEFTSGDYFAWSANGTSETSSLARTAVSAWSPATAATPSVKANSGALTTAAATAAVTVTHFTVMSASTAGTQRIDWTALTSPRTLAIGDQISIAAGAMQITLD